MFTGLLRTIILYILIIAGVRLMGKRQVGELEPSELVLSLIIADLASVPMQDYGIPLLTGVVPILTLLSVTMILSVLTIRALLCGRPSIVVRNGTLDQQEMAKTRLTLDELLEELRGKGYTDLSQIKYAILETNGQLSVLPYANQKPPTARDMKVSVEEGGLPQVVVSDGKLLERNLKLLGHDRPWLDKQLAQRGCRDVSQVFLLLVDEADAVYFAKKES